MSAFSQVAGALLVAVTLADIFFTVLFPASGHGPLRRPMSRLVWRTFRWAAGVLPARRRRGFLTYSGPVLVAASIVIWPVLLICGWALVYYPALGSGIVAGHGPTVRSWTTAFYYSGFSLSTLGTGDVVPAGAVWRWLTVIEAATGFAVVSMVITYFLSIYSAIVQRRTFAGTLDNRTQRTADSARLVVGLVAEGGRSALVGQLSSTGEFLERLVQTHQSYPVLRYFHYREVRYALPRILLLALDTAALLSTAIPPPDGRPREVRGSSVALVHGAARDLLTVLLPRVPSGAVSGPEEERQWRARFAAAVEELRRAGLDVRADDAAADEYVRERRGWDAALKALSGAMLYSWPEIEPGSRGDRRDASGG